MLHPKLVISFLRSPCVSRKKLLTELQTIIPVHISIKYACTKDVQMKKLNEVSCAWHCEHLWTLIQSLVQRCYFIILSVLNCLDGTVFQIFLFCSSGPINVIVIQNGILLTDHANWLLLPFQTRHLTILTCKYKVGGISFVFCNQCFEWQLFLSACKKILDFGWHFSCALIRKQLFVSVNCL